MGEVTRVDLPALRRVQPRVEDIATGVRAALAELVGALDAEGPCWGADETGQTFNAAYGPAVATVQQGFGEFGRGVDSVARALSLVADQAEAVDTRSASQLV
jgi:hypothetical protein